MVQSDSIKRRTFGAPEAPNRPAVSESVLMSSQENQYQHSPFPYSMSLYFHLLPLYISLPPFGLWLSLGWASASLGSLAVGALRLWGWGGPWISSCQVREEKKVKDTFNLTLKDIRQSK